MMAFPLTIIFYRFLSLLLLLEPTVVALPWLTRRDMTWGDSPGQAIIDIGAAGFGALNQFWNQFIIPSEETEYSPDPIQSQSETPNAPEWTTPPFIEPSNMKKCSASSTHPPIGAPDDQLPGEENIPTPDELIPDPDGEYVGNYVQQNIKTGRPLVETCDAPNDKPEDAYLVQEISFVESGKAWQEWPSAILVSDTVRQYDIRYDLERKGGKMVVRRVPNYKFLRKDAVVELGSLRRHGWLVGAGEPKEAALIWFEGVLNRVGYVGRPSTVPQGRHAPHFTDIWVKRVFAKLSTEISPHWFPLAAG